VILGCSFDDVDAQRRFAEKYHFPFALLADTERQLGVAYGACDVPTDDYARRIAFWIGRDGKIIEAHPKVDAAKYPQAQLDSIRSRSLGGL
jgi:thioredoxin-dependent peroxiredoxin